MGNNEFDVLIVEDEPVVLAAARRILAPEGLVLDEASDGETAATKLERYHYKLVLSDLMLPRVSGLDLLDLLRNRDPVPPMIMISGYATLDNAVESFRRGAFDFIPKPFDVAELLGVVRRGMLFFESGRRPLYASEYPASEAERESGSSDLYSLGQHTWAVVAPTGSATIGLAETFDDSLSRLSQVALSHLREDVAQGRSCAELTTHDQLVYRVWAPLSGIVREVNERVLEQPTLLATSPWLERWLIRISATDLRGELMNLIRR